MQTGTPWAARGCVVYRVFSTEDSVNPFSLYRTSLWSRLPADNSPMNVCKIDLPKVLKKRIDGKEAYVCFYSPQFVNTGDAMFFIFYSDAEPGIRGHVIGF